MKLKKSILGIPYVRKLSELPNRDGYEFIGVMKSTGAHRDCIVKFDDGLHRAFNMQGERVYKLLSGWIAK